VLRAVARRKLGIEKSYGTRISTRIALLTRESAWVFVIEITVLGNVV